MRRQGWMHAPFRVNGGFPVAQWSHGESAGVRLDALPTRIVTEWLPLVHD